MADRLFKFLGEGAVGTFSGFRWPVPEDSRPGAWHEVSHPLEPCAHGIHVCRPGDLPYWIGDELYEVEAGGARIEHRQKLVVERARLTARIGPWPDVAEELANACIGHVRRLTVRELEIAHRPEARELVELGDDVGAAAAAADILASRGFTMPPRAASFLGFLSDAVDYVTGASSTPRAAAYAAYISAYASDRATPDPDRPLPSGRGPFELERERQATFLIERLALRGGS